MDVRIKVRIRDTVTLKEWWEEFETAEKDPQQHVDDIMTFFNSTLRPGYAPREALHWEPSEGEAFAGGVAHTWSKTNLVTLMGKGGEGAHDTCRCEVCGVTGKRYGLSSAIVRDKRFKHSRFGDCASSQAYLARKQEQERRKKLVVEIQFGGSEDQREAAVEESSPLGTNDWPLREGDGSYLEGIMRRSDQDQDDVVF